MSKDELVLSFYLDPKNGIPYYKQIIMQVELAISDGRLEKGEQLPTVRGLAVNLKVNPNTVARAYNEMEIRGIVNTHQGSGTFVSDRETLVDEGRKEALLEEIVSPLIAKAASYGFTLEDLLDYLQNLKGGTK